MNPQTRSLLIQRIIDSLEMLGPGSVFERFAVVLVERIQEVRLVQRGSSVGGSPVGGALDAVSEDGSVVVEASIEKAYFTGSMLKPSNDLDHSLTLAPRAKDIYLLSSQRAVTGAIERMMNDVMVEARMDGRRLHLMDSRSIAEVIVDRLILCDDAIDDLAVHLPVLAEIRDDHPASLNAPPLNEFYVKNEAVDEELDRRLEAEPCVEITGIGGIGKSQAAAACLQRHERKFHYRFWVSGRDIDTVERLASVPVRRGGAERNVSALLAKNSTLLVIDDANAGLAVERLAGLCGSASRILITRQHPSSNAYCMPTMGADQARSLLGRGLDSPVPEAAFRTIWRSVGGHPLSLAMLNAVAREGVSWKDLSEDCANVARLPLGGARLADMILGRLKSALEEELCVFQWAGQSHCDRSFFKHVVGLLRLRSFERHGLTAPESAASIRIHDIAFASLQSLNWLTEERSKQMDEHLENFILHQIRSDGHGLQLIASQLSAKIRSNVEAGDRRPAFLYALSTTWTGGAVPVHLLPDPLDEARRLKQLNSAGEDVAILVVLESIEARERHIRHSAGSDVATAWLRQVLPAYDELAAIFGLSSRQIAEIKHHKAKSLRGVGRRAEAESLFEEVVKCHALNDAKLQLVRLIGSRSQDFERAKQYASEIIHEKLGGGDISPSLLMALGDTLNGARLTWGGELINENEELFLSEALYSAAVGIPQGYHSVASFVRAVIWHAPESVERILRRLPEPTPLMLDDDQSRGAYAEIMLLAAGSDRSELLCLALEAFESLKHPDTYQKRKLGETLYKLGRYSDAESVLEKIQDKTGRIWLAHSLSQVKMELGKLNEAFELVNESVAGAVGVNKKYQSSFLLQRARLKERMNLDPSGDIADGRRGTTNPGLLEQFDKL